MPTHLILLYLATLVTLGIKHNLWNSPLKSSFPSHRQISPFEILFILFLYAYLKKLPLAWTI